jgi:hypothetical protein
MLPFIIVSINLVTVILENVGQCEVIIWHFIPIKSIKSVLRVSTYIITSITARPSRTRYNTSYNQNCCYAKFINNDDCLQSVLVVSVSTKDRILSSLKHDDCLQSILMVRVSTKDRIWSSLKHMMTTYSLFWWSASQQKIVFGLHWNIWWLPAVYFGG